MRNTTTTSVTHNRWVTPRTRGALTGLGLMLLGAWGAIIPFVGPYFDYAYTPDSAWTWTAARGWLQVLPGAVAFFAGLILLFTAHRAMGLIASWFAAAAGAWFVLGPLLAPLWRGDYLGTPVGDATDASMEQLGMFFGLGAVIMLLAGVALGRFSVVGVRDVARAERLAADDAAGADSETYIEDDHARGYAPASAAATARDDRPRDYAPASANAAAADDDSGRHQREHHHHWRLPHLHRDRDRGRDQTPVSR